MDYSIVFSFYTNSWLCISCDFENSGFQYQIKDYHVIEGEVSCNCCGKSYKKRALIKTMLEPARVG